MKLPALVAAGALVMAAVAVAGPTTHLYDDGVSNVLLGPPDSFSIYGDIDMLWGNYFFAAAPAEEIDHVQFGLGDLSPGGMVSVWIFDDPDDDADPTNATPIFNTTTPAANLGFAFNELDIPPTRVEGGFFVAVGHLAELTTDSGGDPDFPAPARFDPDGRADRSWFFYDNDIPEDYLADSGFVQRMDGPFVPIPGAFAIRAQGAVVPEPASACALLGLVVLGVSRRRRRR
ncbi:MAG TPA: PEP-CTERM sorting domain-containing protein [Phycisphaerae bacterium]|nr:PEP-CTERM sorting domain-containing protein [Phycisphaerales bacterium]HRX84004.1 PEP-CTERM sorting domain-containing protein [Phycisphaerae bacterium]